MKKKHFDNVTYEGKLDKLDESNTNCIICHDQFKCGCFVLKCVNDHVIHANCYFENVDFNGGKDKCVYCTCKMEKKKCYKF